MNKEIVFIHFPTIDSTNTWAKQNLDKLDPEKVTCIFADTQTKGRGSFKRVWHSPAEKNIYATLFFTLRPDASFFSNVGQVLAYSTVLVLQELNFQPEIKWPNDILLKGKKVAGILAEAVSMGACKGVVLGVGLNVNMSLESLSQIDQKATSLAEESGVPWDVELLLHKIGKRFLNDLCILEVEGFAPFQAGFNALLAYKGELITVRQAGRAIKGICRGISNKGELELAVESGEKILLISGEIFTAE